jgi:uncharacterized protein (DUF1330 family)
MPPKGYVILTEDIKDPEAMKPYMKAAMPAIAEGGVTMVVADPNPEVIEGEWHGTQTVVLEF